MRKRGSNVVSKLNNPVSYSLTLLPYLALLLLGAAMLGVIAGVLDTLTYELALKRRRKRSR